MKEKNSVNDVFDDDLKNLTTEEIIKKYGAFEEEAVSLEDIEDDVNE